jgi:hypothetical protein
MTAVPLAIDAAAAGLVGALGGVIVTTLAGIATAVLNQRWRREDRQTERTDRRGEERAALRRTAYARYLTAMDVVIDAVGIQDQVTEENLAARFKEMVETMPEWREMMVAQNEASVVAGDDVLAAIDDYEEFFGKESVKSLTSGSSFMHFDEKSSYHRRLLDAMRAEQRADLDG